MHGVFVRLMGSDHWNSVGLTLISIGSEVDQIEAGDRCMHGDLNPSKTGDRGTYSHFLDHKQPTQIPTVKSTKSKKKLGDNGALITEKNI